MLFKLFHKIEREGRLPNSFYEAHMTLIPKLDKYRTKKANCKPISLMNMMQKFSIKYLKAKFNNKIKKRKDHLS
jgi:hypothetical protein